MKPTLTSLLISFFALLIASCGPTPDQMLQKYNREMDSITVADHLEDIQQEADTQQVPSSPNPEAVETELIDLNTRLDKAEHELAQLSESNPGLSKKELQQAIMDKTFEIETIKGQIALLEKMLKPAK